MPMHKLSSLTSDDLAERKAEAAAKAKNARAPTGRCHRSPTRRSRSVSPSVMRAIFALWPLGTSG